MVPWLAVHNSSFNSKFISLTHISLVEHFITMSPSFFCTHMTGDKRCCGEVLTPLLISLVHHHGDCSNASSQTLLLLGFLPLHPRVSKSLLVYRNRSLLITLSSAPVLMRPLSLTRVSSVDCLFN